jgi:outer membrane receptor protein involved in Fe transport
MILSRRLLTLIALGALPLAAQQVSDAEKELEALLNTPIQGASKREQRLIDSPQAIEVLTGDEIRAMGVFRLVDALKLMTSVDVLELNTHVTNITLRGAMQQGQPRTVQILIDGVPLYNAEIAAVDIDNLPLPVDLIDKVEVVRGPSSSLYGANAVVGVIAITTKRGKDGLHGQLRAFRGDTSTSRGSAAFDFGEGAIQLTGGYEGASTGVSHYHTVNLTDGSPVVLDEDSAHQRHSFVRGEWTYGKGSLWLSSGEDYKYSDAVSGPKQFPYQKFTTHTLSAGWANTWMESLRTELRWSHLNHQDAFGGSPYYSAIFADPAVASEYTWMNYTSDLLELQVNWDATKSLHIVGGADHRIYSSGKSSILGFPAEFNEAASGGFLNIDWNALDTLTFSAGARAENESIGGSRTSPRFAVVWNPSKSSSLRAGFYSSTRSPQLLESRVNFQNFFIPPPPASIGIIKVLPNPALEPEKVTSTEIGYRHIFGAFTLDVTAFEMKFTKLISQVQTSLQVIPVPPIRIISTNQYQNTGDAKDRGVEVAGVWRASSAISVGANVTWLDYKLEATDTTPTYTPSFKANAWIKGTIGAFSGHFSLQHVGGVDMEALPVAGPSSVPVARDAYNQANANLAWEFLPGASVALYSRNLWRAYTDQGAGGPSRAPWVHPARRESGVSLTYRF